MAERRRRPGRRVRVAGAGDDSAGRGVSDVVGFVLVFSLIVATVGVVYTTGLSGLQGARDAERLSNAETAFGVLQSNGGDVLHRGAPARATEIKLSDARIGPGDDVTVNVSAGNVSVSRDVTPLVYRAGDTEIVYVQGAVVRADRGGAAMLSEPAFHFGERAFVPIVHTRFPEARTVGGQTRTLVRLAVPTESDRSVSTLHPANGTLTVTVTTTRPGPWHRYFESHDGVDCHDSPANGTATRVACDVDGVRSAVVPVTKVHVHLV